MADARGGLDHDTFRELGAVIEMPDAELAAMRDDGRAKCTRDDPDGNRGGAGRRPLIQPVG
ncbi:MAG: hypothetical protein HIU82_14045 [Proteobacteria bacterium]|nr:hypothetical protein [Pseudomonadota bacterium]